MQYNPIDDSFDRRETVRNTSVFNRLYNLSNTVKNITDLIVCLMYLMVVLNT